MNSPRTLRGRRFWVGVSLSLLAVGCSVITATDPEQCATNTDCFVKFGGTYVCQSGGCVNADQTASKSLVDTAVVTTLDACRSTQECVAARGEGWLCRRDREDPQKKGKCQQLTPNSECRVFGDYKDDQAIMLGALIPGKDSPALAANVELGLRQATAEWDQVARQLQQTNTGADAVAPPRPFAILACQEDLPRDDLRNLFLNSGVALVIGPTALRAGSTAELATELTTARVPLVSPTSLSAPTAGPNIATYYFRLAGSEEAASGQFAGLLTAPAVLIRRSGAYEKIAAAVKAGPGVTELTYDNPASFTYAVTGEAPNVVVLGDGETAAVLTKLPKDAKVWVLPTALPDILAVREAAPESVPGAIKALTSPAGSVVPVPPFGATAYGAAQAYDAVYTSLIAIAQVGDANSPEVVREDLLVSALRRTATADGVSYPLAPATLRELLKIIRGTPDAKLKLAGTSGEIVFSADGQATTRTLSFCTVSENGCN